MNISSAVYPYATGPSSVTCGTAARQDPAGGTVATSVDPAASADAASVVDSGPTAGSVRRHDAHHWHHHHHGRHGHAAEARHGGRGVLQGRYQAGNGTLQAGSAGAGQGGPHAMAATVLDDAVDTLTRQVTTTLADLPAGAGDTQAGQVADLRSAFVESIRTVAAQFRLHGLGLKGAQAGLQQAFDALTTGISAAFPDPTAGAGTAAAPAETSAPVEVPVADPTATAPVVSTAAGDLSGDTTGSTPDSTAAATAGSGGASLLQALQQVFDGVKDSLLAGLERAVGHHRHVPFGNLQELFRKFVACYQEISAAGTPGTDNAATGNPIEVSLVA